MARPPPCSVFHPFTQNLPWYAGICACVLRRDSRSQRSRTNANKRQRALTSSLSSQHSHHQHQHQHQQHSDAGSSGGNDRGNEARKRFISCLVIPGYTYHIIPYSTPDSKLAACCLTFVVLAVVLGGDGGGVVVLTIGQRQSVAHGQKAGTCRVERETTLRTTAIHSHARVHARTHTISEQTPGP